MKNAVFDWIEPVRSCGQRTAALVLEAFQLQSLDGCGRVACESNEIRTVDFFDED